MTLQNGVTKWGNKEIDALTKDLGRGAQPQSSSDFYGQKSLREYKYEQQFKYHAIDVMKDYLFAVLYSGMSPFCWSGALLHPSQRFLGPLELEPLEEFFPDVPPFPLE